jgi:hypothetical protein
MYRYIYISFCIEQFGIILFILYPNQIMYNEKTENVTKIQETPRVMLFSRSFYTCMSRTNAVILAVHGKRHKHFTDKDNCNSTIRNILGHHVVQ